MTTTKANQKLNVTLRLDRETIRKAKILAARRSTSVSALLARQIAVLVVEEEAYERVERQALALLDRGFHLGGIVRAERDHLHKR
jgi:O-phosphoseryl-tRNA(Cys) synthetase